MGTSEMVPHIRAQRIPPAQISGATSHKEFAEQLLDVVKTAANGEWKKYRPEDRSEHAWKAVQKQRQPMRTSDLGHLFLKSPKVRCAVLAFMTAMTERDRRRGPRRNRPVGRRAVDAVSR